MFLSDFMTLFESNLHGLALIIAVFSVGTLVVFFSGNLSLRTKILTFFSIEVLSVLTYIGFLLTFMLPHTIANPLALLGALEIVLFFASYFFPRLKLLVLSPMIPVAWLVEQQKFLILTLFVPVECMVLLFPVGTLLFTLHAM